MSEIATLEKQTFTVTLVEGPYTDFEGKRIEMIRVGIDTAVGERQVSFHHRYDEPGGIEFADGTLTLSGSPLTYMTRVLEAAQLDVDLRDHEDDLIRGATRIGTWWVSMCGDKRRCYLPWSPERMGLEIKRRKDGKFMSAKYNGTKVTEDRALWLEREFGTKAYLVLPHGPDLRTDRARVVVEHKGRPGQSNEEKAARANVEAMIREAA